MRTASVIQPFFSLRIHFSGEIRKRHGVFPKVIKDAAFPEKGGV